MELVNFLRPEAAIHYCGRGPHNFFKSKRLLLAAGGRHISLCPKATTVLIPMSRPRLGQYGHSMISRQLRCHWFWLWPISPGLTQGCGIHLEVPSKFVFEMMLWILNIHFNFGGFPNFGRLSQDPRWRTAAILESEVWLSQWFFGVYQCVIYVEILNLGPGIHSSIY